LVPLPTLDTAVGGAEVLALVGSAHGAAPCLWIVRQLRRRIEVDYLVAPWTGAALTLAGGRQEIHHLQPHGPTQGTKARRTVDEEARPDSFVNWSQTSGDFLVSMATILLASENIRGGDHSAILTLPLGTLKPRLRVVRGNGRLAVRNVPRSAHDVNNRCSRRV
jgi:hypothetical protein